MSDRDVEIAWSAMFDELTSFKDPLEMRWLHIAAMLLSFSSRYAPPAEAWEHLPAGEPWATVLAVEARATADLIMVDPELFELPDENENTDDTRLLSYATPEHITALHNSAQTELTCGQLVDSRLSHPIVAHALAGAIDNLVGSTYVQLFKNVGELKLEAGKPYPVHNHDPRPWLGRHAANTDPSNLPGRDLSWSRRLRIAHASPINYVLDFEMWNRLSPLGAERGLVVAVAQPNHHLGEFDIRWYPDDQPTYANRGPRDRQEQTRRIKQLVEFATRHGAEVIVLPEYALSEEVRDDLVEHLATSSSRPLLLCAGISGSPDADDYVGNEAWLLAVTPGMDRSYSPHAPAKIYGAKVGGFDERIRSASEVRIFMSEHWTIAALICRDAMDENILRQIAIIGTNILLVPAMSQKTATMVGAISGLCHMSQAFVALANGPAKWTYPTTTGSAAAPVTEPLEQSGELNQTFPAAVTRPEAPTTAPGRSEGLFAGPYESHPASFLLPPDADARSPADMGLWLFSAAARNVRRVVLDLPQ